MTRRTALPNHEDLQLAIKQLTEATGKPPTVLALAGRLGLANTTFRRNYPEVTADLIRQRSTLPARRHDDSTTTFERLRRENARLRSTNHHLAENLELAIANIQRLTLDNHQRLEATTSITRIDNRHRPSVSISRPQ